MSARYSRNTWIHWKTWIQGCSAKDPQKDGNKWNHLLVWNCKWQRGMGRELNNLLLLHKRSQMNPSFQQSLAKWKKDYMTQDWHWDRHKSIRMGSGKQRQREWSQMRSGWPKKKKIKILASVILGTRKCRKNGSSARNKWNKDNR